MARYIGIRHRVKKTKEGESRPTMIAISEEGNVRALELATETDELDFMLGSFPTGWRKAAEGEDLSHFLPRHRQELKERGAKEKNTRVPTGFDGLKPGDIVATALGGSGDRLAYAMSRRSEEIGATVMRIPPFRLLALRGEQSKDDDHILLAGVAENHQELCYVVGPRDRDLIAVSESYRARRDAQRARIACEQRLLQRAIGEIFLSQEGRYPEGEIEEVYNKMKASDEILANLEREEARREAELKKAVAKLDVWNLILKQVEGCGEVLAAGIITPIADIRRFATDAKLKAFAGVHVMRDGRFPRRRGGEVSNWSPQLRQALYLLGTQFNYRAESAWGLPPREYKLKLLGKRPEVVTVNGKKRYTNGHIHKMATWRTITKFVEWLHREWSRVELAQAKVAE